MLTSKQRHCLHHMGIPYWQLRRNQGHDFLFYICMVECYKQPYCCIVSDRDFHNNQQQRLVHQLVLSLQGEISSWQNVYNIPQTPNWILLGAAVANCYFDRQLSLETWLKQTPDQTSEGTRYTVIPDPVSLLTQPKLKAHAWQQIQSLIEANFSKNAKL